MKLSLFQRPSRYIDGEYNSIGYPKKPLRHSHSSAESAQEAGFVRCVLSFPDVYEVGMSHLGLKILYDVINSLPSASAERIFSPWTDLEEYLRRSGLPLASLESNTPLEEFDIVGFSLQYELSYTTVLNMLSLGGIPVRAEERLQSKKRLPLIVAGGPCTVNPAPMSPFMDAFLVGDGEYAVKELVDTVGKWKLSGDTGRESLLLQISRVSGFYVPSVHGPGSVIRRQFISCLDDAPYPLKPVVPYASIVHDRVNIEVARGCAMGCRFCQAGMIYRPLRERSPEKVLQLAGESLRNTGHDEVSFTSLSAGDYSHLLCTVSEFNKMFGDAKVALSLPSLRVASVNRDILKEIRSVRKTGFTMAPEAATERLRNVINKDFSDDDYEKALSALFEEGWQNLKLYFMIGLPTERDEDIAAIRDMAMRALRTAKKNTGRFVNISITISPFVPKAHTPFQWCGQEDFNALTGKLRYLKESLGSKKFKYKGHDERMSLLEAVFARGDERLSGLIEQAWKSGCRLDGWSELFDFTRWLDAMDKTGIDGPSYAGRSFGKDERLPWDNIDTGVKKEFLYREYERALSEEKTADCRKACAACGLKCAKDGDKAQVMSNELKDSKSDKPLLVARSSFLSDIPRHSSPAKVRVRVRFSKTGRLRYLSHLELVTAMLRGLRRARVPFDLTKGFHPAPKVSFGPPLSVGIAGEREYFDLEVFTPFDIEFYGNELNATLPEGIRILKMAVIPLQEPSLSGFITKYEYRVTAPGAGELSDFPGAADRPSSSLLVRRDGKEVDISPCIERVEILEAPGYGDGKGVRLVLRDHDAVKVRVGEITEALFGMSKERLDIARTAAYGWSTTRGKGEWVEPL